MTGQVGADGEGLVDPARFPCRAFDLDTDAMRGSAGVLRAFAAGLVERMDDIGARWVGLAPHYVAPEAARVLGLIAPARMDANTVADVYEAVASRVERYADELDHLRHPLRRVEDDAWAFRDRIRYGVEVWPGEDVEVWGGEMTAEGTRIVAWHEHGPSVEKNARLLREYAMLLEQVTMSAESAAAGVRLCHDTPTGTYATASVGAGSTAFVTVAYGSGDGPAVPPDVDNNRLESILDEIYDGTTNPRRVGDGKLSTALLNEIKTGKKTHGMWHAEDGMRKTLLGS